MTAIVGKPVLFAFDVNRELRGAQESKANKMETLAENIGKLYFVGLGGGVGSAIGLMAQAGITPSATKFIEMAGNGVFASSMIALTAIVATKIAEKIIRDKPLVKFDSNSTQEQLQRAVMPKSSSVAYLVKNLFVQGKNKHSEPKLKM